MWKKPSKTKEPDNSQKAYEYAVFLLSLSMRTKGEIKEKMTRRGYQPEVIDEVLIQLVNQRYLDDVRYAQVFLENLIQYKNFGFYRIKKKMMEKKLPPEIINKTLEEALSLAEELKIAKRLLKKQGDLELDEEPKQETNEVYYSGRDFDSAKKDSKNKWAQKLKSRGFRNEVIIKALR